MKKEVCLMCIVCFFLGYFVADVVSKCGFGREHLATQNKANLGSKSKDAGGGWCPTGVSNPDCSHWPGPADQNPADYR